MKKVLFPMFSLIVLNFSLFSQENVGLLKPVDSIRIKRILMSQIELNSGFGIGKTSADYSKQFLGFSSAIDYYLTKRILTGIGAGLLFYNGGNLVPLYLDLRYIINSGKMSVYFFGDWGILLDVSDSGPGNKMLINPGVGIKLEISKSVSLNLGTGLFVQTAKETEHDSFINLKLGLTYLFGKK